MKSNVFNKIYVNNSVSQLAKTKNILQKLNTKNIVYFNELEEIRQRFSSVSLTEGKKTIVLTDYKGKIVKSCPGTDESYLCCKYIIINQITNCPLECTYCILQTYTNSPYITIYPDTNKIFKELDELSNENPNRILRIGTGELSDSFALDYITDFSSELISYFSNKKNLILELKTKTTNIENLKNISNVPENIVISWSVNPSLIAENEESKTATIIKRLESAKSLSQQGYKIGLHFDPILFYENWDKLYIELVDSIFRYIQAKKIMWISLGAFRFIPKLKEVIQTRFPKTNIIYSEHIKGNDGKIRYPKPIRKKIFKTIYDRIKAYSKDVFVYFCMEDIDVWKSVMGFSPSNNDELDLMFEESIKKRFKKMR